MESTRRQGITGLVTTLSIIVFSFSAARALADPSLIGVPANNNFNIPPVDPAVVLTPTSAEVGGVATGPLNGVQYGPDGWGPIEGSTGFVTSRYVIPASNSYQVIWEVSDVSDFAYDSALAIDNARLTTPAGTEVLWGFEAGIPVGFTIVGVSFAATSAAVDNLAPTEGSAFAFLDTAADAEEPPIFDTIAGTGGSRLLSALFEASEGDILEIDMAFLTNDATQQFADYAIAVLRAEGSDTTTVLFTADAPAFVPEPASVAIAAAGLLALVGYGLRRRFSNLHASPV